MTNVSQLDGAPYGGNVFRFLAQIEANCVSFLNAFLLIFAAGALAVWEIIVQGFTD